MGAIPVMAAFTGYVVGRKHQAHQQFQVCSFGKNFARTLHHLYLLAFDFDLGLSLQSSCETNQATVWVGRGGSGSHAARPAWVQRSDLGRSKTTPLAQQLFEVDFTPRRSCPS
jgi:hypothetical protein